LFSKKGGGKMYFIGPGVEISPGVTSSGKCAAQRGSPVTVQGFVQRIRSLGGANFIILRDGTREVQVFAGPATAGFAGLREGHIVRISGLCRSEARAPGGFEVAAEKIETQVVPPEELALTINKDKLNLHLEVDLANRPLTLRHSGYRSLFKLQEGLARGFREFLLASDFTEIFTPKITGTGSEGGANVFSLDYFGRKAYLAQSPQLYKQMMVGVFGRVFEIGPVFRAEPHDSARHLNEYVSLDLEMGFINNYREIMVLETACLGHIIELLKAGYAEHLKNLLIALPDISRIPVIHVNQAHELILMHTQEDYRGKGELTAREEQLLCSIIRQQTGCEFVFVTHYSSAIRPFYAMDDPANPQETLSFDLLFRGMEITTGGQRIHEYSRLVSKMQSRGMKTEELKDYLSAFKYGLPPHGGLAIGLERLTALLAGYDNVRYGCLFPRDMLRLTP
jgi:nondiscriminating aspartyl-tRNA synthetase